MCGFIAGIATTWDREKIKQSLELLSHRGPDGHNYVIRSHSDKQAMLAHARLSIVGVSNGTQPLHFDGIWAVVNGEFYDYKPLREKLQKLGFIFQTQSDSEVLLYLYRIYGTKCLDYLHGEFAFVLYDEHKDVWFAARDRFGIRPLNWTKTANQMIFASEAKAFKPFMALTLDKDSLWFSQHFQYLPQDRTLFENVNMVKPAHYLWIEKNTCKEINYWRPNENITKDSPDAAAHHLDSLLNAAVARRIPDEVKACTHLSGGIDSSAITALASENGIKDSFTISFTDDSFYNEIEFAKETALKTDVNLHIVEVNFEDILNAIPKAIYHAEGLSINGHLGGKHLLNKAIHEAGFKVALSGEGSDEIFMGYSHLKQDYLSGESLSKMEQTYLAGHQLPSGATLDLHDIEKKLGFVPTWLKAKSSMAEKFSHMWSKDFANKPNPNAWLMRDMDKTNYSKLKQSSFLWTRYCLSGYILKVLDDAQAMAYSIEGRLPFLDTQLVDYIWSLPDEYYFEGNTEKNLLRRVMKDKLPKSIIQKTKQSFMSPPLTKSLQTPKYREMIEAMIFNQKFTSAEIFDIQKLRKNLDAWQTNPTPDSEPLLMSLLSIASFMKEF